MLWVEETESPRETPGLSHLIVMITFLPAHQLSNLLLRRDQLWAILHDSDASHPSATTFPWKLTNCTYSVNFVTDFEILSLSSNSSIWPKARLFPHSLFSWEEELPITYLSSTLAVYVASLLQCILPVTVKCLCLVFLFRCLLYRFKSMLQYMYIRLKCLSLVFNTLMALPTYTCAIQF